MVVYIVIAVIILVAAILIYKRKKREKEMPAGLQIFDANGKLILDYTEQTYQLYGSFVVTGGIDGSYTDNRIKENETFIILNSANLRGGGDDEYYKQTFAAAPIFTIVNGKISWKYYQRHSLGAYIGFTCYYGGIPK